MKHASLLLHFLLPFAILQCSTAPKSTAQSGPSGTALSLQLAERPEKTYEVPAGIDRSGKTDVHEALNDFLSSVPDNAVVRFPEDGVYRCGGPVEISGKRNWVVDGRGSRLLLPNGAGHAALRVQGVSDLTLEYLFITTRSKARKQAQMRPNPEQTGLQVISGERILLQYSRLEAIGGSFLEIGTPGRSSAVQGFAAKQCIFRQSGGPAVLFRGGRQVQLTQNFIGGFKETVVRTAEGAALPAMESNVVQGRRPAMTESGSRSLEAADPLDYNIYLGDEGTPSARSLEVQSRSAESVYTVPRQIDPTGKEEVSAQLNKFLAEVPDGAAIRFPAGAVYRCELPLVLKDRKDLSIDGQGATIIAKTTGADALPRGQKPPHKWPRTRAHFRLQNCDNIQLRNLKITGPNEQGGTSLEGGNGAFEAQHGVQISGSSQITLNNLKIEYVYGDFVYIGNRGEKWSNHISVENCHFHHNGRQGIAITAGEHILIENNYLGHIRRSSIDFEPNTPEGGARHITIRNNVFGPGRLTWLASKGRGGNIGHILVENNLLNGKSPNVIIGIDQYRRGPITIRNNMADTRHGNPSGTAWQFLNIDGLTVVGNFIPLQPGRNMKLVRFKNCTDVTVQNNALLNAVGEATELK